MHRRTTRMHCSVQQPRCSYVGGGRGYVKCHCRESAPKSVHAYVTELSKSVSQSVQVKRAGGGWRGGGEREREEGDAVRNGPPEESRKGERGRGGCCFAAERRNLPSSSSTALSATCRPPFSLFPFLRRDARITFPRRCVRACVCGVFRRD